jgi:hypothetical protein
MAVLAVFLAGRTALTAATNSPADFREVYDLHRNQRRPGTIAGEQTRPL